MLRGPLHNAGAAGKCEACGEPFPCPTGIAIFESVVTPDPDDPTARVQYLYDIRLEQMLTGVGQLINDLRARGQAHDEEAAEHVAEASRAIFAARRSMYLAMAALRRD